MKVLIFHLTGNANVKAVVNGMMEASILGEFHVSLAPFPGTAFNYLGKIKAFSEIRRRNFPIELKPYTKTFPFWEVARLIAGKAKINSLIVKHTAPLYIDNIVQKMDNIVCSRLKKAKKNGVTAVYGYEDSTAITFREAKKMDLKCLYDLPIGYWRTAQNLLEAERQKWPEWQATLSHFQISPEKLQRKDEELKMADGIFVASSFTANSLHTYPGKLAPVKVIPYGFPNVNHDRQYIVNNNKRPLRLLFVGSLSQRKGLANLFAAVANLKDKVELTLVGYKLTDTCAPLNRALTKHKWIPTLSHEKILKLMRESDVLVFPSLFEGFGLVVTEAMSQGTPVITTERTVGPDIINHGDNGWLVTAGSTEMLQSAIEDILHRPAMLEEVGRNAMKTAASRPWSQYQHDIGVEIASFN